MQDYGLTLPEGYGNFQRVRSENFSYALLQTGENISREKKIIYPQITTAYTTDGNRIIRWELPNDGNYDFSRSYIQFTVQITHAAGTPVPVGPFAGLPDGVWNIFQRMRHFSDTQLVEEKNDYGRIYSFLWVTRQDPTVTSTLGTSLLGFGLPSERYALGAVGAPPAMYTMPVMMGFINCGILPLHAFPRQYFEMHLADPSQFMESNWTQNTVVVDNLQWHIEKICGTEYYNKMWNEVQKGNFQVRFETWATYQNANITTQQDLTVAVKNNIFKGVFTVYINTNDWNNTNIVPFYHKFYQWPKLTTTDFQFRIAGEWWPELPIDTTGQARPDYLDYTKWTESWRFDGITQDAANIGLDDFNGTAVPAPPGIFANGSFVMIGDFTTDPASNLLNNISTRKVSPDLQMRIRLSGAPPAGTSTLHFVQGETIVVVPPCRQQFTVIS